MPLLHKPKYELDHAYQQLALELDVETLEIEAKSVSAEEAKLRSETALRALLSTKESENTNITWMKTFEILMEGGWPWRQAAYIAWASTPTDQRSPRTQDELATQHLGLTSDRAISTWRRKNPAIDQMVAVLQSAPLWEHRADFFANLIQGMKKAGEDYKFFNHLKMYGEMTGDYIPLTQLAAVLKRKGDGDLSSISEEELAEDLEEAAVALLPALREQQEEHQAQDDGESE